MNTNALKARLVLEGLRIPEFLEKLRLHGCSISRSAFHRKISGKSEFDRREILAISKELNLSSEELMDIFFNQKVS